MELKTKYDPTRPIVWSPGMSLDELERHVIIAAFSYYAGNKTACAQSLGIAIRTLDTKLAKYEVDQKEIDRIKSEGRTKANTELMRSRYGTAWCEEEQRVLSARELEERRKKADATHAEPEASVVQTTKATGTDGPQPAVVTSVQRQVTTLGGPKSAKRG